VDKSVEKRGSFTLSARSVSGRLQIGEKVSEIEMTQINSISYTGLYIVIGGAGQIIAMEVTNGVRKSLILYQS
jgi:hypothetical protein